MRNSGSTLIRGALVAAGCFSAPAGAQTANPPQQTSHQCVIAHLPALATEVRQHMQAYRAANPAASQDQIAGERHSFIKQVQSEHPDEVAAAKQACGIGAAAANPPPQR